MIVRPDMNLGSRHAMSFIWADGDRAIDAYEAAVLALVDHHFTRIDVWPKGVTRNAGHRFSPENIFCGQLLGLVNPTPDGGLRDFKCASEGRLTSSGRDCGFKGFETCHIESNRQIYSSVNRHS